MKRIALTRMTRGTLAALALSLVLAAGIHLSAQSGAMRPDVEKLLDEGLSLFKQDNLEGAQQKFEKALMLDVTSEEALAWVEKVGYHQLLAAIGSDNASIESQMNTLLELTTREVRQRERDPQMIEAALTAMFGGGDRLEQERALYAGINTHGVYLLPGLVARTAEADQPVRVRAIIMITKLSDDAVLPLSRVLQSSTILQVQAAIAALQRIGNPAAIPSLLRTAEIHPDSLVRESARDAARALGAAGGLSASDALLAQANRFYNDSNYMTRTYHDALVWEIDGEQLTHTDVAEWALNELRADQLIRDAIALDGSNVRAHALDACNRMARFAEYRAVQDVIADRVGKGELEESRLAELRGQELEMDKVKSGAYALSDATLLAALDLALEERRPEVAIELLQATRSFITPGTRADDVPAALGRALGYDHRGVRFAAAECISYLNPRGYADGGEVIRNLSEGVTEAGRRVALTIFPEEDDQLHVRSLLERANVASFNDETALGGLERALMFPKDLIVVAPGLKDMPTAELIRRFREDYRTKHTPILVISDESEYTENEATYGSAENGILVVNRSIEPLRLRDDLLAGVLADEARERDTMIAARAAETLRYLAARETSFDLSLARDALVAALENPSDTVRIPACRAIASLGILRAGPALVRICQEGEANSLDLRVAALQTIGDIHRGGAQIEPALIAVLDAAVESSEVQLQRAASRAKGMIAPGIYREN